ncbi:ethanolamine kinase 1-like isoform X1 [Lepisosteus oculatus]|uniref:ethanolamine kinase 1-like isoform X1 n=2 Tax=Lepisosteus oculatus TaxID=7918 RepID=UPI00073FF8A8|nr:PREDICTED: ethanolamine kinase 1-like isoform X1 [Lepisosteus oculatus]
MEAQQESVLHFKISVDENEPKRGVLAVLEKLRPNWKPEEVKLKFFTEGITNQLIGCHVDKLMEDVVLVRIHGKMTDLFVDRETEMKSFEVLHAHNCGPQLYCTFENGICYEYVKGTVLGEGLVRQPAIYRLIAMEMAKLHSIPAQNNSPAKPILWKKISEFLNLVKTSKDDSPVYKCSRFLTEVPSIDILVSEIETLKKHLSQIKSPAVLCHNDLLCKNIIYNEAKGFVRFIDYEYAGYNYQAYDIGNHFNEFAGVHNVDYSLYPNQDLQSDWLATYLETYKDYNGMDSTVSDEEVQKLYVQVCKFSLVSHFSWGLWALLQARYSTIDFDFLRFQKSPDGIHFHSTQERKRYNEIKGH